MPNTKNETNLKKTNETTHKTAVLLINLGSPTAPTTGSVRRFLREFLSDPRVVEIPKFIWFFILNGIILLVRPKKSAEAYASIWSNEFGSPLTHYTQQQAQHISQQLKTDNVTVDHAMRYGEPSIPSRIKTLTEQGHDRIVVLPLYPQFSATTTATVIDKVGSTLKILRNQPAIRYIKDYHDDPAYIEAMAQSIRAYWAEHGQGDKLLLSFHGIPVRCINNGDPYEKQCKVTSQLLAQALNLNDEQWLMTFQSRFGTETWLQPYTDKTLEQLGNNKLNRLDVYCPGFASDCLETLEEIAIAGKAIFIDNGGRYFHYIPALNDSDKSIEALTHIAKNNLQGWI